PSFRCDPRTRYPCSCSSAAATEESTPPLIATRTEGRSLTRARLARPSSDPSRRAGEELRSHGVRERAGGDVGDGNALEQVVEHALDREPSVAEGAGRALVSDLFWKGILDPSQRSLDGADDLGHGNLPRRPGELEAALLAAVAADDPRSAELGHDVQQELERDPLRLRD